MGIHKVGSLANLRALISIIPALNALNSPNNAGNRYEQKAALHLQGISKYVLNGTIDYLLRCLGELTSRNKNIMIKQS